MSDQWISFKEAAERVGIRLGVSDPEARLDQAILHQRIKAGHPGVVEEYGEFGIGGSWKINMTTADRRLLMVVHLPSLQRWLDSFFSSDQPEIERPQPRGTGGRPNGRSYDTADAPLLARMRELLAAGAPSPTAAAKQVIGPKGENALGNSVEAIVDRLVGKFNAANRE